MEDPSFRSHHQHFSLVNKKHSDLISKKICFVCLCFQVVGESQKREEYLCFPGDYCGCYSFFYDVVSRGEHQCVRFFLITSFLLLCLEILYLILLTCYYISFGKCKHQLAARLASSLGTYSEIEVSDDHLALMLSKI